jgi:hypothetical protein
VKTRGKLAQGFLGNFCVCSFQVLTSHAQGSAAGDNSCIFNVDKGQQRGYASPKKAFQAMGM